MRGQRKKLKVNPRTTLVSLPDDPDEFFYYEILYCEYEQLIKGLFYCSNSIDTILHYKRYISTGDKMVGNDVIFFSLPDPKYHIT